MSAIIEFENCKIEAFSGRMDTIANPIENFVNKKHPKRWSAVAFAVDSAGVMHVVIAYEPQTVERKAK